VNPIEHEVTDCAVCGEVGCNNPAHIEPDKVATQEKRTKTEQEFRVAVLMLYSTEELEMEIQRRGM